MSLSELQLGLEILPATLASGEGPLIPHLEQYGGPWAIDPARLEAALEQVRRMDFAAHLAQAQQKRAADGDQPAYALTPKGTAVLSVQGLMTKFGSSLSEYAGSVQLRRALRQAVADPQVKAILLRVDSPGGTVAGTGDLADEVTAAAAAMPLTAYIEDQGASAAYVVASQAGRLVAGPDAAVGGIGVFAVIADFSAAAAQQGVKVHVIRAGAYKGAGVPGTEITAGQIANWQREVEQAAAVMLERIARGRGWSSEQAAALADGRSHIGGAAVALDLVDGIETLDAALAELEGRAALNIPRRQENKMMASEDKPPVAPAEGGAPAPAPAPSAAAAPVAVAPPQATVAGLKAAFPSSDAVWREAQLEAGATLEQARVAWTEELEQRNARLEAEKAALTARTSGTAGVTFGAADAPPADVAEAADADWQKTPALHAEFTSREAYRQYRVAVAEGRVRVKTNI